MSHPRGIPRARDLGRNTQRSRPVAVPRAEGRTSHGVAQRQRARGDNGWTATRYEDREPIRGVRADEYHASRLFPNYKQFSRTRTGATMVDTLGREYQIADGIDRLEDQEAGLIFPGSPYLVEPSFIEGGAGGRSIVFSDMGGSISVSSLTFTLSEEEDEKHAAKDDSLDSQDSLYSVSRGPQLLYVRIPIRERRKNPALSLPGVSDEIKLYHNATGSKARGIVREVDGFQFPRASTGSVRLDMLTFFIDTRRLAL